jgi:hypothetical protein
MALVDCTLPVKGSVVMAHFVSCTLCRAGLLQRVRGSHTLVLPPC